MGTTTAKFKCTSITNTEAGATINLEPVRSGSPENESFYAFTPAGSIVLTTVNATAAASFTPGHEFYIDIRPATGA